MKIAITFSTLHSIETISNIMKIIDSDNYTVLHSSNVMTMNGDDFLNIPESEWVDSLKTIIELFYSNSLGHGEQYKIVYTHCTKIEFIFDDKTISYNNTKYPGVVLPDLSVLSFLTETHGYSSGRAKNIIQTLVGDYFTVESDDSGRNIQIKSK